MTHAATDLGAGRTLYTFTGWPDIQGRAEAGVERPAIDDHSGEAAQADAAIHQIKREQREAMAARAICGANAGYQFNGDVLQCFTHRGAKTITAKVTP